MRATGIVRKVDDLGRIVIPIELRRTMNIDLRDCVEIFVDEERIVLKKQKEVCVFCGSAEEMDVIKGKPVCKNCIKELLEF